MLNFEADFYRNIAIPFQTEKRELCVLVSYGWNTLKWGNTLRLCTSCWVERSSRGHFPPVTSAKIANSVALAIEASPDVHFLSCSLTRLPFRKSKQAWRRVPVNIYRCCIFYTSGSDIARTQSLFRRQWHVMRSFPETICAESDGLHSIWFDRACPKPSGKCRKGEGLDVSQKFPNGGPFVSCKLKSNATF